MLEDQRKNRNSIRRTNTEDMSETNKLTGNSKLLNQKNESAKTRRERARRKPAWPRTPRKKAPLGAGGAPSYTRPVYTGPTGADPKKERGRPSGNACAHAAQNEMSRPGSGVLTGAPGLWLGLGTERRERRQRQGCRALTSLWLSQSHTRLDSLPKQTKRTESLTN